MSHPRREYSTRYARRKREQALAAKNVGQVRCQHRTGKYVCGGELTFAMDNLGRTFTVCRLCERRLARICRDCPRRIVAKSKIALRCPDCKHRVMRAQQRASQVLHKKVRLQRAAASLKADPVRYQRKLEYNRLYRLAHPEKTRAQKRRANQRIESASYKRNLEYQKATRRRKHAEHRKRERARYYAQHPVRPTPICAGCRRYLNWIPDHGGKPPKWCDGCAPAGILWGRKKSGRSIGTVDQPPASNVVLPAPLPPRTCVVSSCSNQVTGRRKKCLECLQREMALANELLRSHQGKGRRTDIEERRSA